MIVLPMEKVHFRYGINLITFYVFTLFRHQIYGMLAMESFFGLLNPRKNILLSFDINLLASLATSSGFLVRSISLCSLFCQLDSMPFCHILFHIGYRENLHSSCSAMNAEHHGEP